MKQLNSYLSETIRKRFVQPFSCFVDNHNKILLRTLVALGFVFSVSFSLSSQALEMAEGKYEVIDTGVQHSELIGRSLLGQWLENHKLLINTFSDERDGQLKKHGQVVLFDTKTKQKIILFENLTLQCTNPKSHVSMLKNFANNDVKFFNIREDGQFVDLTKTISTEDFKCFDIAEAKPERLQAFLLDGQSYIDEGRTGHGGVEQAILHLKNKEPIELPFRGSIVNRCEYIPFKNKYLLNNRDIIANNVYKREPDEPYFYYMSVDGELEKIPQSTEFYEQFGQFRQMLPMRDGMILDKTGVRDKTGGLFYLKSNKVIRLYGKSPLFPIHGVIDAPFTNYHLVSPDGCSIAFVSYLSLNYEANKPVKIINVCEEK